MGPGAAQAGARRRGDEAGSPALRGAELLARLGNGARGAGGSEAAGGFGTALTNKAQEQESRARSADLARRGAEFAQSAKAEPETVRDAVEEAKTEEDGEAEGEVDEVKGEGEEEGKEEEGAKGVKGEEQTEERGQAQRATGAQAAIAQIPVDVRGLNEAMLNGDGWARRLRLSPQGKSVGVVQGEAKQQRETAMQGASSEANGESDSQGGEEHVKMRAEQRSAGWRTSPFEIDGRRGGAAGGAGGEGQAWQGAMARGGEAKAGMKADGQHGAAVDGARAVGASVVKGIAESASGAGAGAHGNAGKDAGVRQGNGATVRVVGIAAGGVGAMKNLAFEGGLRQAQMRAAKGEAQQPPMRGEHTPMEAQIRSVRSQAMRGVAAALTQGDQSVTLKLEPATLGEMRVKLKMNDGQMTADFEVSSTEARRLLERSSGELRQALEARGVQVEKIEVQLVPTAGSTGEGIGAEAQWNTQGGMGDGQSEGSAWSGAWGNDRSAGNAQRGELIGDVGVAGQDAQGAGGEMLLVASGIDAIA